MPTFDENTHYIVEMDPEEGDDYIYIGLDVRELPHEEAIELEHNLFEPALPVLPKKQVDERIEQLEKEQETIIDVLAEMLGV